MDIDVEDDEEIQKARQRQGPCNPRLDFLATPGKRRILSLWLDYASGFPPEKTKAIKVLLQELYSLSPEDTEAYFDQLRQEARKKAILEKKRRKLKKQFRKRLQHLQRKRAYRMFEKLLMKGMHYAFYHNLPPLMSIRLKNISDVILEQICELRQVPVPDRSTEEKLGLFLVVISDWFAVALEHVFYLVYIRKNQAMAEIEAQAKRLEQAEQAKEKELDSQMLDVDPQAVVDPIKIDELK